MRSVVVSIYRRHRDSLIDEFPNSFMTDRVSKGFVYRDVLAQKTINAECLLQRTVSHRINSDTSMTVKNVD